MYENGSSVPTNLSTSLTAELNGIELKKSCSGKLTHVLEDKVKQLILRKSMEFNFQDPEERVQIFFVLSMEQESPAVVANLRKNLCNNLEDSTN